MSALRRRMLEDMRLNGLSARTQESYVGAVSRLARHYGRSPDVLSEEEVRRYFLYLHTERKVADHTLGVYYCGIRFFFEKTLGREWRLMNLVRVKRRKRLPVVLSPGEVKRILGLVRNASAHTALTTIYACGLRISEAAHLRVSDIDTERMQLRVREGKGGKDRYVPMSARLVAILREHWRALRPEDYLFPGKRPGHYVSPSTIGRWFKLALAESEVAKQATVHTLRHSYATSLLDRGVSIRLIQEILGHKSPQTTSIYTHVTQKSVEDLRATLDDLIDEPKRRS